MHDCVERHRLPQKPQFALSLCRSTQAPEHIILGARHPPTQVPDWHEVPVGHG